jgi:hypothetical protein
MSYVHHLQVAASPSSTSLSQLARERGFMQNTFSRKVERKCESRGATSPGSCEKRGQVCRSREACICWHDRPPSAPATVLMLYRNDHHQQHRTETETAAWAYCFDSFFSTVCFKINNFVFKGSLLFFLKWRNFASYVLRFFSVDLAWIP